MGWYIRKSFNAGPFRLNLSRSGLGASFGVKGARVGTGPRGSYIHMGVGGLYYRQSLSNQNNRVQLEHYVAAPDGLQKITSADISQLTDASSESILEELNRVKRHIELVPLFILMVLLEFWIASSMVAPPWVYYVGLVLAIPILILCRHYDVTNGTAILRYDLGSDAQNNFDKLINGFELIGNCTRIWHIEASGNTFDWKRNAGANQLIRRKWTVFKLSVPARVQCNIKVPTFSAGKQTIYCFPDRILVYATNGVGSVSYKDFQINISKVRYIEAEWVPTDSKILGQTWRFVNKNGGPDRRFNNNREIPIVEYEQMFLKSPTGLNELFMLSKVDATINFIQCLRQQAVQGTKA